LDDAVAIWNGMAARLPALVLQPSSVHDIAAAVGFAREHGLLLGIKGGGHNIAGTSMAPGGLTVDLSGMREVSVDPRARLAHVGPGCLLGDVDQATQALRPTPSTSRTVRVASATRSSPASRSSASGSAARSSLTVRATVSRSTATASFLVVMSNNKGNGSTAGPPGQRGVGGGQATRLLPVRTRPAPVAVG
jgi:FAD/FMN-containing dehydrogenase